MSRALAIISEETAVEVVELTEDVPLLDLGIDSLMSLVLAGLALHRVPHDRVFVSVAGEKLKGCGTLAPEFLG